MTHNIITDFSKVLLFPIDKTYSGKLNELHQNLLKDDEDYDFWQYFELNEDLLEFYENISRSVDVYIFTTGYIQEYPPLKERLDGIFKNIFISSELGFKKNQSAAYARLAELIGTDPKEILYIDDKQENIAAAKQAGMAAKLYKDNNSIMKKIESVLAE